MLLDLRAATPATCGGKAGALGQLMRAGIRVPAGVVVPPGTEVRESDLSPFLDGVPTVAVRSSASAEDRPDASAAGQHDSFLGVRGAAAVVESVRACRESLWSARAVAYRRERGLPRDPVMAVLIQHHVDAEVAGVLFTGDAGVRIEASWGLGESVAHGTVTPDSWTVSAGAITARRAGEKLTRVDRGPTGTTRTEVTDADRRRPCLTDAQVHLVAAAGREVEDVLGVPVDVEWALAAGEVWVLQARPVTVAPPAAEPTTAATGLTGTSDGAGGPGGATGGPGGATGDAITGGPGGATLTGTPGSPGAATGPARILRGPADFARAAAGDVIVCRSTDPAWTPLFAIAAGFVTETGGVLSHAAIVAREHRIPAVLGVAGAMTALRDGQPVTVHGEAGTVHIGHGARVAETHLKTAG